MSKVLFFDVDGTVTESCKPINHFMAKYLSSLSQDLVFISGTDAIELQRMVSAPLMKMYKSHYLLGCSGATGHFVSEHGVVPLWDTTLCTKDKQDIISSLQKLMKKYSIPKHDHQILDRKSQVTFSILGRFANADVKATYDPDQKKRKEFVKYLAGLLNNKFEIRIGGTTSIDITPKGLDKAYGIIKFLQESHHIAKDCYFFGDQLQVGGNDYPVKKTAVTWLSVNDPEDCLNMLRRMFKS